MTDAPLYTNLRDYLRVLRANRFLILIAAILFAGGAIALTAGQKSQYRAQSTLSFQNVDAETANLIGVAVNPTNDSIQRVQINAATITRPAIVAQVARELGLRRPTAALVSGVSAAEDPATGFLVVQVQSSSPGAAQSLANAYAQAVKGSEQSLARSQFAAAALRLKQIARQPAIASNPIDATTYQQRIANLEFEAESADPVQIATNAALPTAPVSPHRIRDGLLGLLIGLAVGLILAFGRDALDRRIRGSHEISEQLGWPILGHIREDALGRAGFVSPSGSGKTLEEPDLEAFRILRQNIQFLNVDQPPGSITVTSARPEEGKSTVAVSLACASALTSKLTLLIDCDLRRPTLAKKLGVPAEPGLTDYLLGTARPADILRAIPLGTGASANGRPPAAGSSAPSHVLGSQLVLIPAGSRTSCPSELLSSQRLHTFLSEVCAAYDLVVIDTPPLLAVADALEVLPITQGTLLCVRASRTTTNELRAVKETLARLPERPTGVVITGVPSGSASEFGYYSYQYQ